MARTEPNRQQLQYIIDHVFLPPKLPEKHDDNSAELQCALAEFVNDSAERCAQFLPPQERVRWVPILQMLKNITITSKSAALSEFSLENCIKDMQDGDVSAFLIRAQNAGLIMRRSSHEMTFEMFEVSPSITAVLGAKGKLRCSYPGPAIKVPLSVVDDPPFLTEFASFLGAMDTGLANPERAPHDALKSPDTADPRYITAMLTGILRGLGEPATVKRICKRIGDDVLGGDYQLRWRRSPLWLLIRVALQTSLDRDVPTADYKSFGLFLTSRILREASKAELDSDILSIMRAKISRRLQKIGSGVADWLLGEVSDAVEKVKTQLEKRWEDLQKVQREPRNLDPDALNPAKDSSLSLTNSREFLARRLQPVSNHASPSTFEPSHFPRLRDIPDFKTLSTHLPAALSKERYLALLDFEHAVEHHLDSWASANLQDPPAPSILASCMHQYLNAARMEYRSSSEDLSLMILTVFELWVALDRVAVTQCPLLKRYSPEVNATILHSLLLSKSNHLRRLESIEKYLGERHGHGESLPSIFSDDVNSLSFSVQFFQQSLEHQSILEKIQTQADKDRKAKVEELRKRNEEYHDLTDRTFRLAHTYGITNEGRRYHPDSCNRCRLESQAEKMTIQIHEWPLPATRMRAQAAVFELNLPPVFGVWRTTVYYLLHDICTPQEYQSSFQAQPPARIDTYQALQSFCRQSERITWASSTKLFSVEQYSYRKLPTTESQICVNNGLQFQLFDKEHNEWAAERFKYCNIAHFCTLKIPPGPYQHLQYAVKSTSHTSNDILASQSTCPPELTIHEYIAFVGLRSGHNLSWLNVLRELRSRCLRFGQEAVSVLLTQATCQVGPPSPGNGDREYHKDILESQYADALLEELQSLLRSIQESWLEGDAARVIVLLTSRLLASNTSSRVAEKAYVLLRKVRDVTFSWMIQLVDKLHDNVGNASRKFQSLACKIAATCKATYVFDKRHLRRLLYSAQDFAVLVQCDNVLHNNVPAEDLQTPDLKRALSQHRRLSHALEVDLSQMVSIGLDKGIKALWTAFENAGSWIQLDPPNERWFHSRTPESSSHRSQVVHYNILDGQLRVDGKPLGRLPPEILTHPTFIRIFGKSQQILEVIPSSIPDMEFATLHPVSGNMVHFKLLIEDNLMNIRAIRGQDEFELIPHHVLKGDIPQDLVDFYAQWLNLRNREIEFRSLDTPWISSGDNWLISFQPTSDSRMSRNGTFLVDIRSQTFSAISSVLSPIERAQHLKVLHSPADNSLSVDISRYNLSFIIRNGTLECQNYRGMVVDPNQYVGALFGLRNMLVLCPSEPKSSDSRRMVLIPSGTVSIQQDAFHVSLQVDLSHWRRRIQYHTYKIDTELGCLTECASLEGSLFKIYLHGITSHCLPDPLTGQTGTEEAIYGLCSSATWSFRYLEPAEVELLKNIGSLTPHRDYAKHNPSSQQVQWCNLPSSAQHGRYYRLADAILQYASQVKQFNTNSFDISQISRGSIHLLERSESRNAVLYPEELADLEVSDTPDVEYHARDILGLNTREAFVAGVVDKLHHPGSHFNINQSLLQVFEEWSSLEGPHESHQHASCIEWLGASLPASWLSLYDICQHNRYPYRLIFTLSVLAYTSDINTFLIETLVAFATFPEFRDIVIPPFCLYTLSDGYAPRQEALREIIGGCAKPFEARDVKLPRLYGESDYAWADRQSTAFQAALNLQISHVTDSLMQQWPCFVVQHCPRLEPMHEESLLRLADVYDVLQFLFDSCHRNVQLRQYVHAVQDALNRIHEAKTIELPHYHFLPSLDCDPDHPKLSINLLFARAAPEIPPPPHVPGASGVSQPRLGLGPALQKLVREFVEHPTDTFVQCYGRDLRDSCQAFESENGAYSQTQSLYSLRTLEQSMRSWESHVDRVRAIIRNVLEPRPGFPIERVVFNSGLWPRLTTRSLLGSLSAQRVMTLSQPWKIALISLGKALTYLHRAQRLVALAFDGETPDFFKELGNTGYKNWDVESYPDWLLIQVENRFLLRAHQAGVALEMISPQSDHNTVMQLNMGEGKSSVIIPMISAALADSTRLVRVVVLKPLAPTMFQLLAQRLGGLTNRRIYYLPFSRSIKIDGDRVGIIQSIWEECLRSRGILLVQPEHLLSFKLMGIEGLHTANSLATRLVEAQYWLERNTRDILDESDEILSIRYQLIYAVGTQEPLEDHPDRWTTMQQILSLVKKHSLAPDVRRYFRDDIEVLDSGKGTFPQVRILGSAGSYLIDCLAESIKQGDLPNLKLHHLPFSVRQAAISFITHIPVPLGIVEMLKQHCEGSGAWKTLLLLRGLLAQGILPFILKEKRWRVHYGLDPKRSLLAVPYRAKDNPAPQAEFGHPDVTLGLTCLSYYYGGLSDTQVEECFKILLGSDNPVLEYSKWVAENPLLLPEGLRELGGVNPEDPQQLAQSLIPLFRFNHSVIDFFLAQVVFPKQAKQFPHRLPTSSWDIAMEKKYLTTGFSGTNDNRYLLPLPISQGDLPKQLSTNAMVLNFLLQPENDHYLCVHDENHRLTADHFLGVLVDQQPPIRVLLDVGAQMLEFRNEELAEHWLSKEPHAQAAIFFDDDDKLRVLGRDGRNELFSVSPYNTKLDQCLVYLDDVHTRGTDLKLPTGTRGAVTLGAKLNKDRLLQACLRLRKLGGEHSVMFFAPPDIDQKIRAPNVHEVHSSDILRWAMLETHAGLKNNTMYWAQQGLEYKERINSWTRFTKHTISRQELLSAWLQPEAKTLQEMYGLVPVNELRAVHPAFQDQDLREKCRFLGVYSFPRTELDEEQERELALEVEQEQQIERPPPTMPAKHALHPDVRHLVDSGVLIKDSPAFLPAFPNNDIEQYVWSNRLFVTKDFAITIEPHLSSGRYAFDDYMCPVHWILSSTSPGHGFLVILSPFEVNELLPMIRTSTKVLLHIYTPRITEAMKSTEDFKFFTLPSPPRTLVSERKVVNQLNLFAGQLYLQDYQTYLDLCKFLGVICGKVEEQPEGVTVQLDGFMKADIGMLSSFKNSPLPYLKKLISCRRKGQSFLATDIGSILHAKVLTEETFSARSLVDAA